MNVRWGHFIFKYRNSLFPIAFATLFIASKPAAFMNDPTMDRWAVAAGVLLALAGVSFRLAVIGYAYIKRGGKEGKVYADDLVVRGFFAHSRNPMYMGNMLIVLGSCLLYGSVWAYAFVIPFFLYSYWCIVLAEESYLRKRFGKQYEDYAKRVNRFIPDFRGLGKSLKEFRYDWKRAIRKDYGTALGTGLLLLVILNMKDPRWQSWGERLAALEWNPCFAALVLFYVGARLLKKSGRLASRN